jgi:parvulin-like peptidyl-prolyl isomerase
MKQQLTSILLTLVIVSVPARAETIDRIVAVIDRNFIITLSDIRQESEIQLALGSQPGTQDAVLESLIEKHLFEQQMALFRDLEIDEDEVGERMRGIRIPQGLSAEDVRNAIREEIRRNEFTIQRFGPFVKVTDDEVRDAYEKTVLPKYKAAGGTMPTVEQGMQTARSLLIADKMNKEVDDWLADLRKRTLIEKIPK